jgi:predicted transcriptional regulator
MPIMTIRLTKKLSARVGRLARAKKVSRSEVVRQGIEALEAREMSAFDRWKDVAGVVKGGPRDLSTNPKHMAGFGR